MKAFAIAAALAATSIVCASPAAAGVFVNITYTGTATGYSRDFTPGKTSYVDEAFSVTYKFYEDEGPGQDYSLGAVFSMAGIDYVAPQSSKSYDQLVYGHRATQLNMDRVESATQPWLSMRIQNGLVSPDHPDSRIEEYDATGTSLNHSNWFYLYGPGVYSWLNLTTTTISVETFAGDPPTSGSKTNLTGYVPEPGTWALMVLGFGTTGAMLRRRRPAAA